MFPILYEQITPGVVPANNGLGILADCISCEVEQEANGIYELTIEYPLNGLHAEELKEMRHIKVKPNPIDDPQLFRIDRIGKVMNGTFMVYAKHKSYDLSGYEITTGTASSAAAACALLEAAASGYTITTDKTTSGTFKIETPGSVRSYFVGREGSFVDVYGGEIKYDNFRVDFKQKAGQDRGETIRYRKNLLELSQEISTDNLYTHVLCFYKQGEDAAIVGNKVATGLELEVPKTLIVDASGDYEEAPTQAALTTRAQQYVNSNNLTVPTNNITLDFVQSEELTSRVDIFDTVSIYYEALGITRTQVKCIRTRYDCIREKYIETEFGDAKSDITDTIVLNNKEIKQKPSSSEVEAAAKHAADLITGNRGGYVIMHDSNGDGEPDEILIMNTADINTATKVWRWNQNGLGYSNEGYDPSKFGLAMTADGQIVADYITTGTLSANRIKAGILQDAQGNSSINMTTGAATMKEFKSKTAFWLVNSDNEAKGLLYIDSSGNTWFSLRAASSDKDLVRFWANDANGSGVFNLLKTNGNAIVEAGNAGYGGGGIGIRNNNNYVIGELKEGSGHDGMLYLKNSTGGDTIWCLGQSGAITCVSLTQTSSRKVKENIKPMTSEEAEKILQLEAVSFDYKNKDQGTDKRGFIAEEVEKILPNLVSPETDKIPATLDYIEMIPYLQKALKDQQETIETLKNRLEQLEKNK